MKLRIIGIILVVGVGITIAYFKLKEPLALGIYNPVKIDEQLVDPSMQHLMSGHKIGSFYLIDQNGKKLTDQAFEGKVYVADFFFTTCPGICKAMAKQMNRVQEATLKYEDFLMLSHTVQPEVDSPAVLLEYATLQGAIPNKWIFATGSRMDIFNLARKSYFAATLDPNESENNMVHTENFVLIDKEKRIRGIYDGTSEKEVDQLIEDIETLMKSYDQ